MNQLDLPQTLRTMVTASQGTVYRGMAEDGERVAIKARRGVPRCDAKGDAARVRRAAVMVGGCWWLRMFDFDFDG